MIYLVTALYAEAHPFIARFRLKKEISHTRFQVFRNEDEGLCLVISGTGLIPAAAAISSICTMYGVSPEDFLLNAGVCAQIRHADKAAPEPENPCRMGEIFLCGKIKEQHTGRTFYPDLLYRHPFAEAQIITGPRPYLTAGRPDFTDGEADFCLYDMEASAVYQAGAYFFGPHQMSFLKVVSDGGNPENVTPKQIERLLAVHMESIADYIATLKAAAQDHSPADVLSAKFSDAWTPGLAAPKEPEQLYLDLHCSRTMQESVRQHLRYAVLSGADYMTVLEKMYREGKLPCKDKREGKKRFEELKQRLL